MTATVNVRFWQRMGCAVVALIALLCQTATSRAATFADSQAQWSGVVNDGTNGWITGYRNVSFDNGGPYDYATDFILFDNDGFPNVDGLNSVWTGTSFAISPGNPPWTTIDASFTHPNHPNGNLPPTDPRFQEHWTIRRFINTSLSGNYALEWSMSKQNPNCGDGVVGYLFKNGVQVDTASIASNDTVGVNRLVLSALNVGDIVDLALAPGAGNDFCDGSFNRLRVTNNVPLQPQPPAPLGPAIADSRNDFTTTGAQGPRWFGGYHNVRTDFDGTYNDGDMTLFQPSEWNGSGWDIAPAAPWTELYAENTHPNGINNTSEHTTIRRYVADVAATTPVGISWNMRKTNPNGTGTDGRLLINGVQVDSGAIVGNDSVGFTRVYYTNLNPGDKVELLLGPTGPNGDRTDGADGSANRLTISQGIPAGALTNVGRVADSRQDFTPYGQQGANNWLYGYHDVRANGAFSADELILFNNTAGPDGGAVTPAGNNWSNGRYWDLQLNSAPWTEISVAGGHPAGPNGNPDGALHWAVRRWISTVDSELDIRGLYQTAAPCGDGTVGRILLNGTEVLAIPSRGTGENYVLQLDVAIGDVIDFAIDPDGAGVLATQGPNAVNDGCDGTTFTTSIHTVSSFTPVPEPSTWAMLICGAAAMVGAARRRGK